MQTLHPIDCQLIVKIHRQGHISALQLPAIACDLCTSPSRIQRSLDTLIAARVVQVLTASNQDQKLQQGAGR